MKIGIFTNGYPPVTNGVSTSVETQVTYLTNAGHTCILFVPEHPDNIITLAVQGLRILRVPSMSLSACPYPQLALWKIDSIVREARPELTDLDLVISHDPFLMGSLASYIAKTYRVPHISVAHTDYVDYARHYPAQLPTWLRHSINPWLTELHIRHTYNQCTCVVSPSKWQAQNLRCWGVLTPITIIPTAIPVANLDEVGQFARDRARYNLELPQTETLIGYVGRCAPEKNIELALATLASVTEQGSNIHGLFIGPSSSTVEEILHKAKSYKTLKGNIYIKKSLPHEKLMQHLAAFDVLLFPTINDTQNLGVGEAIRRKVPVVVTNQDGAQEWVINGVNGYICSPTPEAMSNGVLEILTYPTSLTFSEEYPDLLAPNDIERSWRQLITPYGSPRRIAA